ncbi:MAG: hypothetical protein ISS16_01130 [Ignavibacteria bacterium]|nr:hypothetical protein [Ignavibacteria bacterium]
MKKHTTRLIFILLSFFIILGSTNSIAQELEKLKQENETLRAIVAPPPSSLDKLFPPVSDQPIFLYNMLEMGMYFSGIMVDLFEGDIEGVTDNFNKFKTKFTEISKLVPEWEHYFNIEAVESLGAALGTGDQGKIMTEFENVGGVCQNCHYINTPKVQQKYHWKSFKDISVKDPLTEETIDFIRFMQFLDVNFTGISLDIQQGQIENARKQFEGFNARFQSLKTVCIKCHDSKRTYYVDEKVQSAIDELGETIKKSTIDKDAVNKLSYRIGMESCFKCHLVHIPAEYSKNQWKKLEEFQEN